MAAGVCVDLREAVAEVLVALDQRGEVGDAAERLDGVARALDPSHHVGSGDRPCRVGVPLRARAEGDRVGRAVLADAAVVGGRDVLGQVRRGGRGLALDGGEGEQLAAPQAQGAVAHAVVGDVGVHVVDVTGAEHVEHAARARLSRAPASTGVRGAARAATGGEQEQGCGGDCQGGQATDGGLHGVLQTRARSIWSPSTSGLHWRRVSRPFPCLRPGCHGSVIELPRRPTVVAQS